MDTAGPGVPAVNDGSGDSALMARFGYTQELNRTLRFFQNFAIGFTYLSPVVGIYSLFVLGLGTGGPAYLWLMPVVVGGQLLVALIFAEIGSSYPLAGALFQWGKNLVGPSYGWFVGWAYGWALLATIAAITTGVIIYAAPLLNDLFGTTLNSTDPNTIFISSLVALAVMTLVNSVGVRFTAGIASIGVWAEILATIGIAILLAVVGFHHGLGYLFSSQGTQYAHSNPLGVNFNGNWLLGAAFIAILAHVWIFYGFESAADVGEEVIDAGRTVPRGIIWSLLIGGLTSFILVGSLILAIPSSGFAKAASFAGGVPYIVDANVTSRALRDIILLLVVYAFFSCGTSVQAAATRVIFSYARDEALPASGVWRNVSRRFQTPVNAILLSAVIAALFSILVHFTPAKPITVAFVTYPANVNALVVLVSFGVSGIYIAFQMVMLASLIARWRGWRPDGPFQLGAWAIPINIVALIYGVLMIINIIIPTGLSSPRGALFNYDWMTLLVVVLVGVVGLIYYLIGRPALRVGRYIVPRDDTIAAQPAGGGE